MLADLVGCLLVFELALAMGYLDRGIMAAGCPRDGHELLLEWFESWRDGGDRSKEADGGGDVGRQDRSWLQEGAMGSASAGSWSATELLEGVERQRQRRWTPLSVAAVSRCSPPWSLPPASMAADLGEGDEAPYWCSGGALQIVYLQCRPVSHCEYALASVGNSRPQFVRVNKTLAVHTPPSL
ncbi:hypothetical protein ACLOJK_033556 [Asimina triloba]